MELTDFQRIALKNIDYYNSNNQLRKSSFDEVRVKGFEAYFKELTEPASEESYLKAVNSTIGLLESIINTCSQANKTCDLVQPYNTSVELLLGAANAGMKGTPEFEKIENTINSILTKNEQFIDKINDELKTQKTRTDYKGIAGGAGMIGLAAAFSAYSFYVFSPIIAYPIMGPNIALAFPALLLAGIGVMLISESRKKTT